MDQQTGDEALLASVWDYIDRNGLEPEALRIADQESPRNGTERMTLEQINAVIRTSRADRAARAAKTR